MNHAARNQDPRANSADHEILEEWVYNTAGIDGSRVVWARDMGVKKNQELITYFQDRQVWLMETIAGLSKDYSLELGIIREIEH